MPPADPKIAIILHGPPNAGKSTISGIIQAKLPPGATAYKSLDAGWLRGQFRHLPGPSRYLDLSQAQESVLIIAIGCGEPSDLSFNGATRAADEWLGALRRSKREIFPFRLWLDWDDMVARSLERHKASPDKLFYFWQELGVYSLYNTKHEIVTFPASTAITEERIMTSKRTEEAVAEEIMIKSGLQVIKPPVAK